uniref:Immunoglobulin-binding protein 1 n=1 Tax=Cacopsylla melanoneura TaxID=428564 RepID=A0A8D8ZPP4_9HEMI
MSDSQAESSSSEATLSSLFDEALLEYEKISNCDLPTNSSDIQYKIKKCMTMLEDCTRMVSLANIFSTNEHVDEIATNNVKYFLLPILLGYLTLKVTHGDRLELIQTADIYFRDFLKRCKDYSITDVEVEDEKEDEASSATSLESMVPPNRPPFDIGAMARTRAQKIARFKEQKDLEGEIENLRKVINKSKEDDTCLDDELIRNYYLKLINSNVSKCVDEIECLMSEKQIVKFKKDHPDEYEARKKPQFKSKPMTPIIITKDELQKKVFGAGYPSLPKYTVQEFYEQRVRDGIWQAPSDSNTRCLQTRTPEMEEAAKEQEDEEKETKMEEDDPEELARLRAKDEFKDTHKRGFGKLLMPVFITLTQVELLNFGRENGTNRPHSSHCIKTTWVEDRFSFGDYERF